ncbi:MAG: hypothetical protein QME66_05860 [Candidatus Eisenbacteria bacterium]|nr:hypothetical protein [Candidatus Eisenbacteria bacterium]
MKPTIRKLLVKKLDNLFSLYIRLRTRNYSGPNCPFCSKNPIECCFHFITRAKYSVRWDDRNAVGSCSGCNYRMEYDPHKYIKWYIDHYGKDSYDELIRDSNIIKKRDNEDLRLLGLEIKQKMFLEGLKKKFRRKPWAGERPFQR